MGEEEREALADFRRTAALQARHDLAIEFAVFEAAHAAGIDRAVPNGLPIRLWPVANVNRPVGSYSPTAATRETVLSASLLGQSLDISSSMRGAVQRLQRRARTRATVLMAVRRISWAPGNAGSKAIVQSIRVPEPTGVSTMFPV